jgi:SAM-dependent methyltransferase
VKAPASLREVWRSHITIEDYERHMAAVGQAQANASLLEEVFRDFAPRVGARILFAGAGTGQCFDYLPSNLLSRYRATFADINRQYLARLAERLRSSDISTVVDDIEDSRLAGPFDLAVAILVLEHVDWRRAVKALARQSARLFLVIQQNPAGATPVRLEGSMVALSELHPQLVDRDRLVEAVTSAGFQLQRTSERQVLDGKRMLALDFVMASPTEKTRS